LVLLKNCENVIALLQYNNQAAAAVDYIMFNFDNFSISDLYGQVLLKKAALYGNCILLKTKVCKTTTGFSHYAKNLYLFSFDEKLVLYINVDHRKQKQQILLQRRFFCKFCLKLTEHL
jgi:uncharacterized membrane protein